MNNLQRTLSKDEFYNPSGGALPEQRFKNDILNAQMMVIEAEQILIRNKRLNNGVANSNDLAEFESRLVSLFSYVKFLIKQSEKLRPEEQTIFSALIQVEVGRFKPDFFQLQTYKNFLLRKILRLGITNILRSQRRNNSSDDF